MVGGGAAIGIGELFEVWGKGPLFPGNISNYRSMSALFIAVPEQARCKAFFLLDQLPIVSHQTDSYSDRRSCLSVDEGTLGRISGSES